MITNDELKDYAEGRFIEADKHVEICTELLALREQNRWRKYPDEKPEIRQRIWICLKDDDDEVLGEFEYTAVFCQYCNTFAPHFDGYERFIHPNFTGTLLWRPLPSAPDAKGGE
jgi:hypothetical protein